MNNIIPTITITDTRTITRVYKKITSNTSTPNPNPIFMGGLKDGLVMFILFGFPTIFEDVDNLYAYEIAKFL